MTSRPAVLGSLWVSVLCAGVGGCSGLGRPDAMIVGPPAMPTIAPAPAAPRPSETEIVGKAVRLARDKDFSGALGALQVDNSSQRSRLILDVATALAEQAPEVAAAFATALPAGLTQTKTIEVAAAALTRRNPDEGFRWAVDISDPATASTARRAVMAELVRSNARAAIDRVLNLPAGRARDDTLVIAAAAWARVDPDGALSWLAQQPANDLKPRLTSSIGLEISLQNPERAITLAETLPPGRNRWLLFSAIAQTWVAVDPKGALAWANRLPAGEPRDAAFAGVDTGLGVPVSRRIAGAPSSNVGSRTPAGGAPVPASWPELNSPEFAAWLKNQPPGLSREEAILEYIRQRGALDTGAIGQWVASLPGSPTRDRAMEVYLENLLVASPRDAANWLRSLPRSDRSDEMIEKTARRWLLTNPEMAEAWLRETPLLPDRKEQLLREAGR